MEKLTAVEWLMNEIYRPNRKVSITDIIDKAMEMERQQKIDLLTKYHDSLFYIPFKEGEAEAIYNHLNTVEK